MTHSYAALCTDHYINQRLNLKMDLALRRDTVLNLFDRVRKSFPTMTRLRRYPSELALETRIDATDPCQQWVAVRKTSLRSGVANPGTPEACLGLHKTVLELCPCYLDVTALDVDQLELLFGFDLHAPGNHDAIVGRALLAGSPMGSILDRPGAVAVECQPLVGICLESAPDHHAFLEVKTRSPGRALTPSPARVIDPEEADSPISVYLIVRHIGSIDDVSHLPRVLQTLAESAADLIDSVVIPSVLAPLRTSIATGT